MQIKFKLLKTTRTCYRFQSGEGPTMTTLYLKKDEVDRAGINPENGIVITVEEDKANA